MFDFDYRLHQSIQQERLQKALERAALKRAWKQAPQSPRYRRALSQFGDALVAAGTRLQLAERHSSTTTPTFERA